MSYAGESNAKKIARAEMYRRVAALRGGEPVGSVFALAGPCANDLGPIAAFGVAKNPANIMLADTDREGLDAASAKWPGVLTHHGWAHEAPIPWGVDLLVADLCGALHSRRAIEMLTHVSKRFRAGSLCAVTYLRGREGDGSAVGLARSVLGEFGPSRRLGRKWDPRGAVREVAAAWTITLVLRSAGVRLWPRQVWSARYQGHASPMSMVLFRLTVPNYRSQAPALSRPGLEVGRASTADLLAEADDLDAAGIDAAAALAMSRASLAALRAHRTRGTYSDAP